MRERFYDLLVEEKRRNPQRTFLVSTHLIDEVARVLDYAVLIDAGRLLCAGTVEELQHGYLSVSGAPDVVRELTVGMLLLKEEEMGGSMVRHVKLNAPEDQARIEADTRVRTAPVGLQRLFVFLTEEKEAERHGAAFHVEIIRQFLTVEGNLKLRGTVFHCLGRQIRQQLFPGSAPGGDLHLSR